MEKLKDLYLNDLLDRETYEHDYRALKSELESIDRIRPKREKVDLSEIKSAISMYDSLTKQGKKEFWSRTVGKIVITKDDEFFVYPISP